MRLSLFDGRLAVCKLPSRASVPLWARGEFVSITRTPDELSIVCDESSVPADVSAERGWRAFYLHGPIPFEITGIAAALTTPLAASDVFVFFISTHDTDWLLVKEAAMDRAIAAFRNAGYDID